MLSISNAMTPSSKYVVRLLASLTAYGAGLVALNALYREHSPSNYLLVLLPVIPLLYCAFSIITFVTQMDEMWRKIITEAFAFSALATAFTCFSFLFVRDLKLVPAFQPEWAFYMMWVYYGVGVSLIWRRYR
jgi:hypothetical protein